MDKIEARKLLIKSRLYRFFALIFACLGFGVFSYVFAQYSLDEVWGAVRDPFLILTLVCVFLPAIVLSWMGRRLEIKLNTFFTEKEDES